MPDDTCKPALRTALRVHEIGNSSPYQLFFAAKAKSGASFGFMQGDLAAGQPVVTRTFRDVMTAAQMAPADIGTLITRLSVHLIANPLAGPETAKVNGALARGSALVDAMDEAILSDVYNGVDACLRQAGQHGRSIAPIAQLYIAMWVNMSGPPSKMLRWIGGEDPGLRHPIPPAPPVIDKPAIESYLQATDYFVENPRNFLHMQESAATGAAKLPIA